MDHEPICTLKTSTCIREIKEKKISEKRHPLLNFSAEKSCKYFCWREIQLGKKYHRLLGNYDKVMLWSLSKRVSNILHTFVLCLFIHESAFLCIVIKKKSITSLVIIITLPVSTTNPIVRLVFQMWNPKGYKPPPSFWNSFFKKYKSLRCDIMVLYQMIAICKDLVLVNASTI